MAVILVKIVRNLDALGVKNQPFVSATFHYSCRGFAPVANVAAISRPKIAYPDFVQKNYKSKFSTDFICMATFVSQEVRHFFV